MTDWYVDKTLQVLGIITAQQQVIEAQLRADQYELQRVRRQIAALDVVLDVYKDSRRYAA